MSGTARAETTTRDLSLSTGRPPTTARAKPLRYKDVSRSPRGLVAIGPSQERAGSKRSPLRDDKALGTVAVAVQ
jgi:hypothetical protein